MHEIKAKTDRIRGFINEPRTQYFLMKSKRDWGQVCASLDALDITTLAIEAFGVNKKREDIGEKYLALYGVLQSLLGQQDSVTHIFKSLKISYEPNPELEPIRFIRHDSVGHPTERKGRNGAADSFCSVAAVWNVADRFYLARYWSDDRPNDYVEIDVQTLIAKQKSAIVGALEKVIETMEAEEKEHKKKFQGVMLEEIFPSTLSYYFGKIMTAPGDPHSFEFKIAKNFIVDIQKIVGKFKGALSEREILLASPHLNHYFDEVEYALAQLAGFFESGPTDGFNERDRDIYAFYVRQKIEESLIPLAREIDNEYRVKEGESPSSQPS